MSAPDKKDWRLTTEVARVLYEQLGNWETVAKTLSLMFDYASPADAALRATHAMERGLGRRMTKADMDRTFQSLLDEIGGRAKRMREGGAE